ncbi:MAG: ABC transporter permease, partial [Candidatus Nanopelagicales bacterium]
MTVQASRRTVTAALPLAIVAAFVIVPVVAVVTAGMGAEALATLTAASTWKIIGYTAAQAVASTLLSVLIALPIAYALYRRDLRGRRALLAIITVPFVLPTVVVGLAFRELLPFPGTTAAIIVAHVFFNVGLVVRVVGSLWGHLDPRLMAVAQTLGLSPVKTFAHVTLPLLRTAILGAAALVFLFTFTSFGVILVLGDPSLPTIEVAIYTSAIQRLDFEAAAGLALLQFVIVAGVIIATTRWQAQGAVSQRLADDERRPPTLGVVDRLCTTWTWVIAIAICLPLLALVARSLRVGDGWGLTWYVQAFSPSDTTTRSASAFESMALSVQYAAAATIIAVALGALACTGILAARRWGAWIDATL